MRKKTLEYIGKAFSPHSLRHSRATHLANNGASVGGISNLLGHASYSTTQIYIKGSSSMAKKVIEKYSGGGIE